MIKASRAPTDELTGQVTESESETEAQSTEKVTRNSYKNSKKVEYINAYKAACENSIRRVTHSHVAGQMSLDVNKNTLCRWWNNRVRLWALVKQVPGSGDLTRVYPRRMEIVEEALYRAFKEEVAKGM
jgi:hypothetical protein